LAQTSIYLAYLFLLKNLGRKIRPEKPPKNPAKRKLQKIAAIDSFGILHACYTVRYIL